jgi:hypothetical protein
MANSIELPAIPKSWEANPAFAACVLPSGRLWVSLRPGTRMQRFSMHILTSRKKTFGTPWPTLLGALKRLNCPFQ